MDTDVLCNRMAPPVTVPDGKIGAVTWKGSYKGDVVFYNALACSWVYNNNPEITAAKIRSLEDLAEYGGYPRHDD
jgi:hypothetical protein